MAICLLPRRGDKPFRVGTSRKFDVFSAFVVDIVETLSSLESIV